MHVCCTPSRTWELVKNYPGPLPLPLSHSICFYCARGPASSTCRRELCLWTQPGLLGFCKVSARLSLRWHQNNLEILLRCGLSGTVASGKKLFGRLIVNACIWTHARAFVFARVLCFLMRVCHMLSDTFCCYYWFIYAPACLPAGKANIDENFILKGQRTCNQKYYLMRWFVSLHCREMRGCRHAKDTGHILGGKIT